MTTNKSSTKWYKNNEIINNPSHNEILSPPSMFTKKSNSVLVWLQRSHI